VIDSRLSKGGDSIRRRRECLGCETRYTTYEEIERVELRAIKRDGRHEPFDRHKLQTSLVKACEKRPIGIDQIERAVEELLHEFETEQKREIPTRFIGAKVMEKLHTIDPIAYVRYASIYGNSGDRRFYRRIQTYQEKRSSRSPAQPELFKA
jgi:transcriptional repressor NrdR